MINQYLTTCEWDSFNMSGLGLQDLRVDIMFVSVSSVQICLVLVQQGRFDPGQLVGWLVGWSVWWLVGWFVSWITQKHWADFHKTCMEAGFQVRINPINSAEEKSAVFKCLVSYLMSTEGGLWGLGWGRHSTECHSSLFFNTTDATRGSEGAGVFGWSNASNGMSNVPNCFCQWVIHYVLLST